MTQEPTLRPQAILCYKLQSSFNIKLFGPGVCDRLKKRAIFWCHGGTAKKVNLVV